MLAAAVLLNCTASDANLLLLKNTLCSSLGGDPTCANVSAHGDWPNQGMYMAGLLDALADPSTCLGTAVAKDTVAYLDETDVNSSAWWWTWLVFQPEYFTMPRQPGQRIESPATLGRKCWAFSFLAMIWPSLRPSLMARMARAGLSLDAFVKAYDAAVPSTTNLCVEVMANCFVNATYDPQARNGTCPGAIDEFFVGFQWENGDNSVQWRNDSVPFPFPRYQQTDQWRVDVQFAVNTALNYIV